jgi:hypothetical protein
MKQTVRMFFHGRAASTEERDDDELLNALDIHAEVDGDGYWVVQGCDED